MEKKKKTKLLLTSIYQNENRISLSFPYKQKGLSAIILVVTTTKKKTQKSLKLIKMKVKVLLSLVNKV